MAANLIQVFSLTCLSFFSFITSEELTTVSELIDFQKWFDDQGGKCRCNFTKRDKLIAVADRQIVEKESILMVPQSLLVNSTTVERYWSNYNHKKKK